MKTLAIILVTLAGLQNVMASTLECAFAVTNVTQRQSYTDEKAAELNQEETQITMELDGHTCTGRALKTPVAGEFIVVAQVMKNSTGAQAIAGYEPNSTKAGVTLVDYQAAAHCTCSIK